MKKTFTSILELFLGVSLFAQINAEQFAMDLLNVSFQTP
jgi:hypothetical protein